MSFFRYPRLQKDFNNPDTSSEKSFNTYKKRMKERGWGVRARSRMRDSEIEKWIEKEKER
jgi:hypothetical protein